MGVTKAINVKGGPLNRLVAFLNFPYPNLSRKEFLQEEVCRLILPLLAPLKAEDADFYLAKLTAEVNRMGLRPHWVITPADVKLNALRHGERVLKIQDSRWVLSKVSLARDNREAVYYDIISSLENGDFGRLRRCPECQKFFAVKNFGRKVCGSAKCEKARNAKTAKDRMKRKRDREKKAEKKANKTIRITEEEKRFQAFQEYMALRDKRNLTTEEQSKLGEITQRLPGKRDTLKSWDKEMKGGSSLKDIWKGLATEIKAVFA